MREKLSQGHPGSFVTGHKFKSKESTDHTRSGHLVAFRLILHPLSPEFCDMLLRTWENQGSPFTKGWEARDRAQVVALHTILPP